MPKLTPLATSIALTLFSTFCAAQTVAANASSTNESDGATQPDLELITIVGSPEKARQSTGAAQVITPEDLKKLAYTDVQRVLRQVPGVSIQIEDGYGLRPNISIRGVATERSGRITLLEDNVLIAPAPYSAPSAYYFPTAARMAGFEVLKGPAAITQGPYTIGGALNMLSTPIPSERAGQVTAEYGQDNTLRAHLTYGDNADGFGYLLEAHRWQSDGYQSIDRTDANTGLDVEDYMAKLRFESTEPGAPAQSLELKFQYARQDSEQSYLGLTDADFNNDAFRRYGVSALDNIETEHNQVIARYNLDINDAWSLSATGYYNDHKRNWFKTEGIDVDGSANAQDFNRTSWFDVIQAVNRGEPSAGLNAAQLQAILDGTADTAQGAIQVRSNAREYYSAGIQLGARWNGEIGDTRHALEIGLRYHEDEEDRLQRNSTYTQTNGELVLADLGLLGNAGNRIQDAEALALHIVDRIEFGQWVLTPGVRFEDIDQSRTRFEIRNGLTNDPSSRAAENFRSSRENSTSVVLPGMGVNYQVNDNLMLLTGAHKGFTAPSNSPGVQEEDAWNFEAGLRYNNDTVQIDAVAFLSDYSNLVGECTASSGADCEIGDAFNGDAASVKGLELLVAAELFSNDWFSIPFNLSYTYTDGEFDTDIADTDFFGDVSAGDPIPYIPDQQLFATIGLEMGALSTYLGVNYTDEVCVRASCGDFERTDDALVWDLSAAYAVSEALSVFGRVENLTSEEDILGRQPYGARPNKDQTLSVGVRWNF
ncbi:MAG: TonB-dependent receptor family protein [Lysobacterales bacterium]